MKTLPNRKRNWRNQVRSHASAIGALFLLLPPAAHADAVVRTPTEAALRTAMTGGGKVTFACDGTISLANTISNNVNVTLDATGRQISISGGNVVRVFCVDSNVTLNLVNVTIANGYAPNGAGILNNHGTVNGTNCTFSGNGFASTTYSNAPAGGAVFNRGGTLRCQQCVFINNRVQGDAGLSGYNNNGPGVAGYGAVGAAVCNEGTLWARACAFTGNSAAGGNGGVGVSAIFWPGLGYNGGAGGQGFGGAIYNSGTMWVEESSFTANGASGGNGGLGGRTINDRTTYPGGNGGFGADGTGGAIFNGARAALINSTFASNQAIGGNGGNGGSAMDENHYYPGGPDGYGGNPGAGWGAIADQGTLNLTNCTIAFNAAVGGTSGGGRAGFSLCLGPGRA